ncbi:MAG: hypothetical protein LAO21_00485 [Acidobacteriia bacterium]|nr:hypothetical protein [Terriglobia bacterium]
MNLAHVHLLLNHIPVLGTGFGLILFIVALLRKSEELRKACHGTFVVVALLAIPAYLTGDPAERVVKNLPGVSKSIIEAHDDAASASLIALSILGVVSMVGFILMWKSRPVPQWFTILLLALALIVTGMMAWTANLGGQIRHTEVRSGAAAPTPSD